MDSSSLGAVMSILEAVNTAKYLAMASFVLLLYDHLICLSQELEFFWKGEWTLTSVLYFLNRYFPPVIYILHLIFLLYPDLPLDFCNAAARITASFMVFGVSVVAAILLTRVYYLWSHSLAMRWLICSVFVASASVAIVFSGVSIHNLDSIHLPSALNQPGCINIGRGPYWPIFVPTFVTQTVLFLATIHRVHRPLASGTNKTVTIRILRDGGIFYCAIAISSGFTLLGSIMEDRPEISMPVLLSNYLLAVQSTCASHLILSIHSLAADIGSNPILLLSHIEISRIDWRPGKNANELIVDICDRESNPETPTELIDLDPLGTDEDGFRGTASIRATRVGMVHRNDSQVDLAARAPAQYRPNSAGK